MLTSSKNPKIKWIRSLQSDPQARRDEGLFVVEGVRLAEEALSVGWQAKHVLCAPELSARAEAVVDGFAAQGAQIEPAAEHVLRAASDTQTPQGVLVVLSVRTLPLPAGIDFVFIPDGIRDPGNLGSMLRTAAAAGVDAVLLPKGGVDPYAPKVVRAAMGAHFRLPIVTRSWEEIEALLKKAGVHLFLADAASGEPYMHANLRQPLALIVGGEAEGAGEHARRLARARLLIPMALGVESVNAAAAAAVLLFEVARQRAGTSKDHRPL